MNSNKRQSKKSMPTQYYCKNGMKLRSGKQINYLNNSYLYKDGMKFGCYIQNSPLSRRCAVLQEFLIFLDTYIDEFNNKNDLIAHRRILKGKLIEFIDILEMQFNNKNDPFHIPADGLCGCHNRPSTFAMFSGWSYNEPALKLNCYGFNCSVNEYEEAEKEMFELHGPGFFEVFEPISPVELHEVSDFGLNNLIFIYRMNKVWVKTPHVSNTLFKAEMENRHRSKKHCMYVMLDALYKHLEEISKPHKTHKKVLNHIAKKTNSDCSKMIQMFL